MLRCWAKAMARGANHRAGTAFRNLRPRSCFEGQTGESFSFFFPWGGWDGEMVSATWSDRESSCVA